jgi:N-acetylmuramic acid 6-phosphate etherase
MTFKKITEQESHYNHLEKMSAGDLLRNINKEDQTIAVAVEKVIPKIEALVNVIVERMSTGGKLFYIGAGTSGRLGILDASECPPTFGIPDDKIIGLIAGGDLAIRSAVENAEDDTQQAFEDLKKHHITKKDLVIGIAASGTTPYVISGLETCNKNGITTGCITCNPDSPIDKVASFPIAVVVGPEFITGSSRMKAGTAQKLILNMISTSVMIQLGHVKGNKMVDMQLSNDKLVDRGTRMIMDATGADYKEARQLLIDHGSVRNAIAQQGIC